MKLFIKLALPMCVASCAINTLSPNNLTIPDCDIIYGKIADWDVISDDLARNIYEHNLNCETAMTGK